MILKRIRNALLMTRAVAAMRSGRLQIAESILCNITFTGERKALSDTMLAYIYLVTGRGSETKSAIERAQSNLEPNSTNGKYINRYHDYLLAILEDNPDKYVESWSDLQIMQKSWHVSDALLVHKLASPRDVASFGKLEFH